MDWITLLSARLPELEFDPACPLAAHTSFQIGGNAPMAFPKTESELAALLRLLNENKLPFRVLGAGTNVLAPDEGVSELVICTKNALTGLRLLDGERIEAMAGQTLTRTAVFARDNGLSGLEFAHGIPGTVGGGLYMNAGAYGGELKNVALETTVLLPDGTKRVFRGEEQGFGYRKSAFEGINCVILKTVLQLSPGNPEEISAVMQELMERRRKSQPLEYPSAGSTFKRPAGYFAGALIEQAGCKGKGAGTARVSEKHAGFVINLGGATSRDVKDTIRLVQNRVLESAGVQLEPEVRIW